MNTNLQISEHNFMDYLNNLVGGSFYHHYQTLLESCEKEPHFVISRIRNLTEQVVKYLFKRISGYKQVPFEYRYLLNGHISNTTFNKNLDGQKVNIGKAWSSRQRYLNLTTETYRQYANFIRRKGNAYTHFDNRIREWDSAADGIEIMQKFAYIITQTDKILKSSQLSSNRTTQTRKLKVHRQNLKNAREYADRLSSSNANEFQTWFNVWSIEKSKTLQRERAKYYD